MEQKAYMLFYLRDKNTSTPENIANDILKHKIVPSSTQNGSYSIPASSLRLENRSTAKPASVVLDKAIPTTLENGTGSTATTCHRSSDRSCNKSVSSVQNGKTMASMMQNGSCDINTVSQGLISVDKSANINLVSVAKPSKEKTVPMASDKAGCALEELILEEKTKIKSCLSKSNRGLVRSIESTSKAFNSSSHQKLKRKVLAYRVASTHLSMRMLCKASLTLQKRKKQKKVKKRQQFVATNILDEQMGPSISSSPEKGFDCGVTKRGVDDAPSDVTITGISIAESCASELNKRTASGDTMPVGDDQSLKIPKMHVALKHQQDTQHSHFNGKINVDTGIAVGRWDDIELESSQTVDANNTNIANIGYVPNEWLVFI